MLNAVARDKQLTFQFIPKEHSMVGVWVLYRIHKFVNMQYKDVIVFTILYLRLYMHK